MRKADRFDKMAERLCSYDTTIRASIAAAIRRVAREEYNRGMSEGLRIGGALTVRAMGGRQRQPKRAPGERDG